MAYKFATGSVFRGDLYSEDDAQGNTYLDWNEDAIGIVAGGTTVFVVSGSTALVGVNTTTPDYTLDVAGNAGFDEYIYHNDDTDTYIRLQPDEINIEVGAANMIFMVEGGGGAQADKLTINNDAGDVDFQVKGDSNANLIRTDAANDRVGIGVSAPKSTLDISGSQAGNFAEFNSDWTLDGTDFMANFTGNSGLTASLPVSAAATKGRIYHIFNSLDVDGEPLIITATSGQTIGHENQSLGMDGNQGNTSISLVSDGSGAWMIFGLYQQSEG